MTIGFNTPEHIPAIQRAQNMMNNGGGGNLGYFSQEKGKDKEEKNEDDIFELSSKEEEHQENDVEFYINKIKNFWFNFNIKQRDVH